MSKVTGPPSTRSSRRPARLNRAQAAPTSTRARIAKSTVNAVDRPLSERMGGIGMSDVA